MKRNSKNALICFVFVDPITFNLNSYFSIAIKKCCVALEKSPSLQHEPNCSRVAMRRGVDYCFVLKK